MLTPFFHLAGIYFVWLSLEHFNIILNLKLVHVIFKCLPLLYLIFRVYNHAVSFKNSDQYSYRICLGLLVSMVADAVMVYSNNINYFLGGLFLFLIAIVFYMQAFGWKILRPRILLYTLTTSLITYYVVFQVFSNIAGELRFCCLLYVIVGQTAIWRAWARIDWGEVHKAPQERHILPTALSNARQCKYRISSRRNDLLAALGSISFAISDTLLAANKFAFPIPAANYIVMLTYYYAQYCFASSVVERN